MPHPALPELIDTVYAAAAGEQDWSGVADGLRRSVGADTTALLWCEPDRVDVLGIPGFAPDAMARQARYFQAIDPWAQAGFSIVETARRTGRLRGAVLGPEIVPQEVFRRTEWYNDFGRDVGNFHLLGAMQPVTTTGTLLVGAHRPERALAFDDDQRAILDGLLPHLRRGLDLWSRLRDAEPGLAAATLDALPGGTVIVDADLRVLHLNAAAEAMARRGAILLVRDGPVTRLGAAHRGDAAKLAIRVRDVALRGGEGGGVALRVPQGPALAATVMRLPARLAPSARSAPGRALVLLRDPARPLQPAPRLLADLYGLTPAEAEVGIAAAAGVTAEAIALRRGGSVNTVRTQIRSVLGKCGAANLRELARLFAAIAA